MRTLPCPACGTVWRVLKEATTGDEVEYFDCCAGRSTPRIQGAGAQIIDLNSRRKFPAASERVGGPPSAEDVTRRGDSSRREVLDELTMEGVLPASPDELSGGSR